MSAQSGLFIILVYGLIIFAVAGVALLWARLSGIQRLSRWLRRSALLWPPVLVLFLTLHIFSSFGCVNMGLYGVKDCPFLPDVIANVLMVVSILSLIIAAVYACLTFAVGALIETFTYFRHR